MRMLPLILATLLGCEPTDREEAASLAVMHEVIVEPDPTGALVPPVAVQAPYAVYQCDADLATCAPRPTSMVNGEICDEATDGQCDGFRHAGGVLLVTWWEHQ